MNPEIKEIIDELIEFTKTWEPKKYLKNAFKNLEQADNYSLSSKILSWHKLVFLDLESSKTYDLSDHEILQEQFAEFFKECPILKTVFTLHSNYIGWANGIDEGQQEEIRNYIHENYKVQVRIRRYKK